MAALALPSSGSEPHRSRGRSRIIQHPSSSAPPLWKSQKSGGGWSLQSGFGTVTVTSAQELPVLSGLLERLLDAGAKPGEEFRAGGFTALGVGSLYPTYTLFSPAGGEAILGQRGMDTLADALGRIQGVASAGKQIVE